MTATGKTVSIILLSYCLFGFINLLQFGSFVVPVTYKELVVLALIAIPTFTNWKDVSKAHLFFLAYAIIGFIRHPFLWEIALDQQAQIAIYNNMAFDVLRILQIVNLTISIYFVSYDKEKHRLNVEWLVPAALSLILLINPPIWFENLLFIIVGLSAFYALKRRYLDDYIFPVLLGVGIIYLINCFYL